MPEDRRETNLFFNDGLIGEFSSLLSMSSMSASPVILLVEDDVPVRTVITRVLQQLNYTVLAAADAEEALDISLEHLGKIDLMLADLVLPGPIKTSEMARQLQAQKPGLKVIFTSGHDPSHFADEVQLEEGLNFLGKPYSASQLHTLLKRVLNRNP